jgi:predicted glycoside hydrolase/deacetylase ChbG (UPF0249 family)
VVGRVVLHGDDLGLSRAVTDGILRGFAEGLLTSTSLLANAPDASRALDGWKQLEAARAAGRLPSAAARQSLDDPRRAFDLGLHLNLTQGRPLTGRAYPAELLDSAGRFLGPARLMWRLVRHGRSVLAGVKEELRRQAQFVLDHGLQPTHVNGHQYVEMMPGVAELIPELLAEFGIGVARVALEPRLVQSTLVRRFSPKRFVLGQVKRAFARRFRRRLEGQPIASAKAFFGTVHAGCIDLERIGVFLQPPAAAEVVEIGLHPAEVAPPTTGGVMADGWHDPLAAQRPGELQLLLSGELQQYLGTCGYRLGRLGELGAR